MHIHYILSYSHQSPRLHLQQLAISMDTTYKHEYSPRYNSLLRHRQIIHSYHLYIYIERAHCVRRRKDVKFNSNNTPRTIVAKFLDYKEKEEVMRRRYKLKDTTYSVREDFSKETVEIRKKLWDQVKKLREDGKYAVIKYDKIVTRDFRPRR